MPDPSLHSIISQIFPPKSNFTENNLPDLADKVYIVTGSNSGIGKELARLLYSKNAKIYIAVRSAKKAASAIEAIKKSVPHSSGKLVFLNLDLNDLSTIKTSATTFMSQEKKLHVLFNNAGIMMPPEGSKSAQGYELQLGVSNLGPFLFTKLLTPILVSTAKTETPNTVRVVWTSSSSAELMSPKPGGIELENLDYHIDRAPDFKYGVSKAGNFLHAAEFAKRYKDSGIISVALNPGNLKTDLTRNAGVAIKTMAALMTYPPVRGAYTELFAGLSPEVSLEQSGHWIAPFGRLLAIRSDLVQATKLEEEGGSGIGAAFWNWTEDQVGQYV